ncbi:hypothetical protein FACS1894110_02540 [Spirochaetia bacterium]|nr:hypothetical protein FACS1894110_02540 [Spirochaetia bacterium]
MNLTRCIKRPPTYYTLKPIYRAGSEVYAECGPAKNKKSRKWYLDALSAKFPDGHYGIERDVSLPGLLHPADFTFIYRHILVRVTVYPWSIKQSTSLCKDIWRRLNAAGIALGVILNFGGEEYEHLRVIHHANLDRWNAERIALRARRELSNVV